MTHRPILLAGATGLIGGLALARLSAAGDRFSVLAPTRRPLPQPGPSVSNLVVGLADASIDKSLAKSLRAASKSPIAAYLCCLGTTLKTAGSRAAFEAVDLTLVLRLARIARELGARHAILVSSVGADAGSSNFYLATKGRAEAGLAEIGFERIDSLRPGLLLGPRSETRVGEAIGQRLAPLYNPLLLGPLRRYRSIAAATVAAAAVALLTRTEPGSFVHEHDAIVVLA
jgi:uncharacterized protein YbjT (DUF2867 family)